MSLVQATCTHTPQYMWLKYKHLPCQAGCSPPLYYHSPKLVAEIQTPPLSGRLGSATVLILPKLVAEIQAPPLSGRLGSATVLTLPKNSWLKYKHLPCQACWGQPIVYQSCSIPDTLCLSSRIRVRIGCNPFPAQMT